MSGERAHVKRKRVTWPAGDPGRARAAWVKDACAYAKIRRRPVVISLIAALSEYLHRDDGYAWVSDATLQAMMGCRHVSAVKRAFQIADFELGLMERETTNILGEGGRFGKRRRLIFPSRPSDMSTVLACARDVGRGERPFTRGDATTRVGGIHPSLNPRAPKSEPKSERLGLDTGPFGLSRKNEESSAFHSDLGEAARSVLGRSRQLVELVEAASFIGTDCDAEEAVDGLLELGRAFFPPANKGLVPLSDVRLALQSLGDAAKRAWIEDNAEIARMIEAFAGLIARRQREANNR